MSRFAGRRAPTRRYPWYVPPLLAALALLGVADPEIVEEPDRWSGPRTAMVDTIRTYSELLPDATDSEPISETVLDVMGEVPRHRFVPEEVVKLAYADTPLPIGYGQSISQPYIIALMTHLVRATPDSTVLEIGTGSGYHAAVLSPLVETVCTIEIVPALGETAARRLADLGYDNIRTRIGDGYFGWPECGPFDAILVTAAAGHVPPPLVEQLKPGGRIVIPVGGRFGPQFLTLVDKSAEGRVTTRQVLPVRFVPLTRGEQ